MFTVLARPPKAFSSTEIDDFVAFVLAGGEVSAKGLRKRVENAECIAYLRRSECLVGVAGLKRPDKSYRTRVRTNSTISLSEAAFPFELGWVFILPSVRGKKQSLPLCQPIVSAAGSAGIFATSRSTIQGMHVTLSKLGFRRAGAQWPSKQNDDNLFLFVRPAFECQC